jgi:hypothetical protein
VREEEFADEMGKHLAETGHGSSARVLLRSSALVVAAPSDGSAAANELEHDDNHRDHQQDMEQPAGRVRREHAKRPQHQQNHRNGLQHGTLLLGSRFVAVLLISAETTCIRGAKPIVPRI